MSGIEERVYVKQQSWQDKLQCRRFDTVLRPM